MMNKRDEIEATIIAVEIGRSNHGDFLKHIFAAWYSADKRNKVMMRPLVLALMVRYKLREEYAQAIKEQYNEYLEAS